jgi:hypothetical protein
VSLRTPPSPTANVGPCRCTGVPHRGGVGEDEPDPLPGPHRREALRVVAAVVECPVVVHHAAGELQLGSATPTSAASPTATPTPGNAWDQRGWTHAITHRGIEGYFDAAASRRDGFSYEAVAIEPGDARRERSIEVFRAGRAPSHVSLAQTQATGSPSTRPRPPGGPAPGVRVGAGYQRCDPASGSTGTGAAARSRRWRRALLRCCRIRHGWSAVWSALLVTGWRASHRARPARQRARRRSCDAAGVSG